MDTFNAEERVRVNDEHSNFVGRSGIVLSDEDGKYNVYLDAQPAPWPRSLKATLTRERFGPIGFSPLFSARQLVNV